MWERLRAGGEGDNKGWDGWMASLTWWTWVWVNSGSWWWTGRPGVLRFMGSQKVGHNWATEMNWTEALMDSAMILLQFSRSVVPRLPVHHQLPEFTQTHVHRVSDAIQPSHPLSSPSPPVIPQHQSLFQWVNSLHEVAKVLEFQL